MRLYDYNISHRPENKIIDVRREPGTTELVTLAEIKRQCKVDFTDADNDILLTSYGKIARASIENLIRSSIIETDITVILQNDLGGIELPWGPVDLDSIAIIDDDDADITDYTIRGLDFPTLHSRHSYAKISYTAGYDSSTLPPDLKQAILCEAAWLYEHRGDEGGGTVLSSEAKRLAQPYKRSTWIL